MLLVLQSGVHHTARVNSLQKTQCCLKSVSAATIATQCLAEITDFHSSRVSVLLEQEAELPGMPWGALDTRGILPHKTVMGSTVVLVQLDRVQARVVRVVQF